MTADFVVIIHVSTARIPQKWHLPKTLKNKTLKNENTV